ncbi:DUF4022 domain-containing protein, partial [Bacillus cereus]
SNGIKYSCLLLSLLLGTASILGLLAAPAYFFIQLTEKAL